MFCTLSRSPTTLRARRIPNAVALDDETTKVAWTPPVITAIDRPCGMTWEALCMHPHTSPAGCQPFSHFSCVAPEPHQIRCWSLVAEGPSDKGEAMMRFDRESRWYDGTHSTFLSPGRPFPQVSYVPLSQVNAYNVDSVMVHPRCHSKKGAGACVRP